MKIRKALDKAKKERMEGAEDVSSQVPAEKYTASASADWASPVYSESKTISLDVNTVKENRCVCISPESPEIDYYKVLRTQIQHRIKEKGWNTVMITSVQPGEGKTVTSINLAITLAKEFNQTVLLVDCDLRMQKVHEYLGYPSQNGLVDYLLNETPLQDLITWPGIDKMTIISGGRKIHETTEIISSPKMKKLIAEMKSRYDDRVVLFDVPPILGGADAISFAPMVDCIIVVVEEGRTSIHDVKKAMEMIPEEKFLGFVLNKGSDPIKEYGKE